MPDAINNRPNNPALPRPAPAARDILESKMLRNNSTILRIYLCFACVYVG